MTFDGEWFWGNSALPHLDNYKYLGVKCGDAQRPNLRQ